MTPKLHINDALPDRVLAGFDAQGRVVCCIEMGATINYVLGSAVDQTRALEWQMCSAHHRRMAWEQTWREHDFPCEPGVM